jgi:hypothetical protein
MSVAAILYFKEIKHLKIESATYLLQGNMFDSCMPSYFLHARV